MIDGRTLTVDVTLRVGDVYDPWRNYLRWAIALFVCYLLYDTRSNWSPASAGPGGRPDLVAIPTLIILCAAILFLYPYLHVRWMFRKYPVLGSSRHFSFSEAGMHLETQDGRADLNWSAFYRIVETRKVFIFMQTHRGGTYVPKRCLSDPEEVTMLRTLIRANFKGKARLDPG